MRNPSDPAEHRAAEVRLIEHVLALLDDPRLRIDTTAGTRPVAGLRRGIARGDRGDEVKKLMTQAGSADRELQARMPQGEVVEILFSRAKWLVFNQLAARLRVICVPPVRDLVRGQVPAAMKPGEVTRAVEELSREDGDVPTTVVFLATGGLSREAHDLGQRVASRTVILVEPNTAGGYTVWGPTETKSLNDLLDPETEHEKRARIREHVRAQEAELVTGGVAADRAADATLLPLALVEDELRSIARGGRGLLAKRLDGRVVLYREGSAPPASAGAGGVAMPLIERIKSIFSGRTSTEKKIAFLSERRAGLSQQRDGLYDELQLLEKKDAYLREQFKTSGSEPARRRMASQLVQLRREMERRQQMVGVLNQQINVVGTHLHNLSLLQQGQQAKLPESEEIAADAARAEEVLAKLQADSELAEAVSPAGATTGGGLGAEEQALFDELTRDAAAAGIEPDDAEPAGEERAAPAPARPAEATRRAEPEAS